MPMSADLLGAGWQRCGLCACNVFICLGALDKPTRPSSAGPERTALVVNNHRCSPYVMPRADQTTAESAQPR